MANEDNNKRNMRIWNILEDMPADKDVCRAMRQCVSKLGSTEGVGEEPVVCEQ